MDFMNSNAAAAANAVNAGNSFWNRAYQWQVQRPLVKAETQKAQNEAALSGLNLDWMRSYLGMKKNLLGFNGDQGSSPSLFQPSNTGLQYDIQPPAQKPDAQTTDAFSTPLERLGYQSRSGQGLPPTSSLFPGGSTAMTYDVRPPGVGIQPQIGKTGDIEFLPAGMTPALKAAYDANPDQTYAQADAKTRDVLDAYSANMGKALGNRKAAAELDPTLLTEAYGNPEERKAHGEFARNAAQLSHRLNEYHDTVSKYGNWEWYNPEGAAKLASLPLDIADNWTKVSNPGGVLREGLVGLGKELQIPTANEHWFGALGIGPRNATTLAGIEQTKNVLADYVRQYENLPYTKAPVTGLTPEVRAMVEKDGKTAAAAAYEKRFGKPVPTEGGAKQRLPDVNAAQVNTPSSGVKGDGSVPGSAGAETAVPVDSQEAYDRLAPGAWYKDSTGKPKRKGGARSTMNAGSTAGAPHGG